MDAEHRAAEDAREAEFRKMRERENAEEAKLVEELLQEPRGLLVLAATKVHFDEFRWALRRIGRPENDRGFGRVERVTSEDHLRGLNPERYRLVKLPGWERMDRPFGNLLERAIYWFEQDEKQLRLKKEAQIKKNRRKI